MYFPGSTPHGIAIDPISRLLFYTDIGNVVISVMTMDGMFGMDIVTSGLNIPNSVAVDNIG